LEWESDDDKSDVEDDDESDDKSDEEDDDGSYSEDDGSGDNEETTFNFSISCSLYFKILSITGIPNANVLPLPCKYINVSYAFC
jgi:hypothetical protein